MSRGRTFGPAVQPASLFRRLLLRLQTFLARASLATRLAAIILALAIPLNLVILLVILSQAEQARATQRAALNYAAETIAAGIDAELGKYLSIGQTLARSPHLLADDLAAFESEARRSLRALPDSWVVVADLDGQQLLNSAVTAGGPLPNRVEGAINAQREAIAKRKAVVSNAFIEPIASRYIATIEFPVFRDDQAFRTLSVIMSLDAFQTLLSAQQTPKSWLAGVIDSDGRYIARVPDGEPLRGELASIG